MDLTRQGIAGVRNLCLVLFPETGAGDGRGWDSWFRKPGLLTQKDGKNRAPRQLPKKS